MEFFDHAARARLKVRAHTAALAAAALAGVVFFPLLAHAAPAAGATAPDFALKDLSGRNQRLSEFRGDVVVLGVSLDRDAARAASVATSLGLQFPSLLDAGQSVGRLYDVQHLPLTLLIDREGTVRQAWAREPVPTEVLIRNIRELDP